MKKIICIVAGAIATVLAGCGSSAGTSADGGTADAVALVGDASESQEGGGLVDAPPLEDSARDRDTSTGCPATPPALASPCSTIGLCTYGPSVCCGESYRCVGGKWQPSYAACACIGPQLDAGTPAPNEGGPGDAAACPSSCRTDSDCSSCPQPKFGGWSCNGGACMFQG